MRRELNVKTVKREAGKYYICDECDKPIRPGVEYFRVEATSIKGTVSERRTHHFCGSHKIRKLLSVE
jgi:hypothetical protein